jgi:ribosome-associated toxin RatA of RatAB toxin-antitoxin module
VAEQTESSIAIAAPADEVMAVIADLEAYPDWNDEVKQIEVLSVYDDEDERPAEVRFVLDAGAIKDDYTLEYTWEGDESVRWTLVGEAQVLKQMDGSYDLVDNGDGTTLVTYRLAVDVKFPMIGLMKRKAEKVIVDRALKGLKKRVES